MKLQKCPFCGGDAKFVDYGDEGEFEDWNIECLNCEILVIVPGEEDGCVVTKEEAAKAWNMRVLI